MLSGTFLAVLFIPLSFVVIVQLFGRKRPAGQESPELEVTTPGIAAPVAEGEER